MADSDPPDTIWLSAALARYERPLLKYAHSLCGHRELARDVVQDTFIRLSRERRRLAEGDLARWLFTVCRHRIIDVLRKERRIVPMPPEAMVAEAGPTPSFTAAIETREAEETIRRFVEELPDAEREVVRLRFQTGLSYAEIAAVVGESVAMVGWRLHQAVLFLRQRCQHAFETP